jgi:Delta24-sterol reductase
MGLWSNSLLKHIAHLQTEIKHSQSPISFCTKGHSNTTRSKAYRKGCKILDCKSLNQILQIDPDKKKILVQPRVTMQELVQATLPYGLIPPVIPEFKGITVGGAIMGVAAESSSHQWGIFHDTCTRIELIDGRGQLITASPSENPDIFYGISGSYGSLGLLVAAEMMLIPVHKTVLLRYIPLRDPQQLLEKMERLRESTQFLDGILFGPSHGVIITGEMIPEPPPRRSSRWFAERAQHITCEQEEKMPLFDYLFRYDQGAFWMGSFLFSLPFFTRYLTQGILQRAAQPYFDAQEIDLFKSLPFPGRLAQILSRPFMSSQFLWGLLHKSPNWVQDRLIIQDCVIPTPQAPLFLEKILQRPGVYPIWLCPIKGTTTPQHFAPHLGHISHTFSDSSHTLHDDLAFQMGEAVLHEHCPRPLERQSQSAERRSVQKKCEKCGLGHPHFMNFGLYGVPAYSAPMSHLMQELESNTQEAGGRKVLYSCSYYTEEAFWKIYPRKAYEHLRHITHAHGIWPNLTDKVLLSHLTQKSLNGEKK